MEEAVAIAKCQEGDADAFQHLVQRYQSDALRHAATLLGGWTDAQDASQDAFVDAWKAIRLFDSSRSFYPWFYTILRNRCLKQIAARKRRGEEQLKMAALLCARAGVESLEAGELDQALRRLSPDDREIVILRHLEGMSYEQLAERIIIPVGTVMSRLYYARRKLRVLLEESAVATRMENK